MNFKDLLKNLVNNALHGDEKTKKHARYFIAIMSLLIIIGGFWANSQAIAWGNQDLVNKATFKISDIQQTSNVNDQLSYTWTHVTTTFKFDTAFDKFDEIHGAISYYDGDKLIATQPLQLPNHNGSVVEVKYNDLYGYGYTSSKSNDTINKILITAEYIKGDASNKISKEFSVNPIKLTFVDKHYVAPEEHVWSVNSSAPVTSSQSVSNDNYITVKTTTSDYTSKFYSGAGSVFYLSAGNYGCAISESNFNTLKSDKYLYKASIESPDLTKWYFKSGLTIKLKENTAGYEFVSIS